MLKTCTNNLWGKKLKINNNEIYSFISEHPLEKYSALPFCDAAQIEDIQNSLFLKHLEYAATKSPFYKELFKSNNINYKDIKNIGEIRNIPLTDKSDLSEKNSRFLAVSEREIIDVCLTSATTGSNQTPLFQTSHDLARLAYNEKIAFEMAGLTENDTILICAALDRCFMAGLAYFLGGSKLNAKMVRAGAGSPAQQWHLLKITKATAIVGVPSLMREIARYALDNGETPSAMGIKRLVAIGEPTRDQSLTLLPVAQQLESLWGAPIFSTYASTELATTFCECFSRQGGHLRPELCVLEIVDEKGQHVADGEQGEVVVTPLGVKGMPLLRFKTGDVSFVINETCSCGCRTPRLGPILGRKYQRLKYKGTTLFPNTILSVLEGIEKFHGGYVEVRKNEDGTDRLIVFAAITDSSLTSDFLKEELRARLRVVPEIFFISQEELNNKIYNSNKRKKNTFFDLR